MMNIGEFSQLTGLSQKALRLYDEQGLLQPAAVDPWSRYRRYTAAQLTTAIRLKALRAAGVGLAEAGRVLADPGQAGAVLAEHRDRIAAERAAQDAALATARSLWQDGERDWRIEERSADPQPWAGVVLPVPDGAETGAGGADEAANEGFAALWKALAVEDNAPTGPFWSSLRVSDDGTTVQLLCCWPIARPVPPGWSVPGWTVEAGQVPAGPELVTRWRHDDPVPEVEGATHPAVVALLAEAEERGVDLDLSRLRQIGVVEDGQSVGVEVCTPLARRP